MMNRKIIKKIATLCIMLAIIAVFSACSNADNTAAPTKTEGESSVVENSAESDLPLPTESVTIETDSVDSTSTTDLAVAVVNTQDPSLADVLSEVESKFIQVTYEDEQTGVTLPYNLFVPENYDASKEYPLITFIHDDSVTGKDVTAGLTQGYGGVIWATQAEQAKHESFVLVPVFQSSVVAGGPGQSGSEVDEAQLNTYLHLLESLQEEYSVDENRLYVTGQSMGCMTSLYLNGHYPDLFAAALYVSGQWDITQLSALSSQKFFYITAGGDTTASGGQTEVKTMLTEAGIQFSTETWDATWSFTEKNTAATKKISGNTNANFVTWETGTVLVNSDQNQEHMASFDYGYTVPAVRDWLFSQIK